jgi:hypothetical protein
MSKDLNLVDVSARFVIHLFGAVEYVDHHAERSAQIFRRLGLPGSGGSGRGSSHHQVQRLQFCNILSS